MRFPNYYIIVALSIVFSLLLACAASPLYAWNRGTMLSPTRVIIQGRQRAAAVKLINPDDRTNRYKISLISMRMDDFGKRRPVESPTPKEAATLEMFRFSPRRATVGPKEWQTIRIMVRKPADLAHGEYRVHLKVEPISPNQTQKNGNTPGKAGKGKEKMSVNLNVLFSITIPVIVRHGEGGVSIEPEQPALGRRPDKAIVLDTPLVRTGAYSALFDIFAYSLAGEQRQKVGELKGVSFYTSNSKICIQIPLNEDRVPTLPGDLIEIEIIDKENRDPAFSGSWQFVLD